MGRGLGCCGVCTGSWAAPGGLRWPRAPKVTAAIPLDSVLLATFGSDLAPTGQPGLFLEPKSGLGFRGTSVSLAQACGSGPCGLFSAETWARGEGSGDPTLSSEADNSRQRPHVYLRGTRNTGFQAQRYRSTLVTKTRATAASLSGREGRPPACESPRGSRRHRLSLPGCRVAWAQLVTTERNRLGGPPAPLPWD